MHAVQAVSVGKEGQPRGKVVPEKAQKRDKDRRRKTAQKTASASCSEEQMPREQLLLTFTDGDRGRADIRRHKESKRRGRKGQPWKEASFRCGRDTECGRSSCWRPEEGEQRGRAEKARRSSEEFVQFMMKQGSLEGTGPGESRSIAGDFWKRQPGRDAIGQEHWHYLSRRNPSEYYGTGRASSHASKEKKHCWMGQNFLFPERKRSIQKSLGSCWSSAHQCQRLKGGDQIWESVWDLKSKTFVTGVALFLGCVGCVLSQ